MVVVEVTAGCQKCMSFASLQLSTQEDPQIRNTQSINHHHHASMNP